MSKKKNNNNVNNTADSTKNNSEKTTENKTMSEIMNLPNKITCMRVILIPFFVFFMLASFIPYHNYIALGIFIVASITDAIDGKLARKLNLVTNFGKFMDPLADKLLVCSALICFVELNVMPAWVVIIIISREFIISGFRLVASDAGIVIAAGWWGKCKTVAQMVTSIYLIFFYGNTSTAIQITGGVLIGISVTLTVVSLVDYIKNNIEVLRK